MIAYPFPSCRSETFPDSSFDEGGSHAVEGIGTWATWIISDPIRVEHLFRGAVLRLEERFAGRRIASSDSYDGSRTRRERRAAHRKKVLCGMKDWSQYTSYREDFEASSSVDHVVNDFIRRALLNFRVRSKVSCLELVKAMVMDFPD